MFYEWEGSDIKNYAGDTTPYDLASDKNMVIFELQPVNSLHGFNNNHMKASPEKTTFFEFQSSEKILFWWSLRRIKFNWKIARNSN